MANEKTPVVWDDTTKKHRPLGTGEKMGGLDASSIISSDLGNLIGTGSDGLAYATGSGIADPRADNLLEASSGGKLQVTPARIAEWLGGHPQDAADIADAINVVSGDSGNVIVEGSDKGAYMSAGTLAAIIGGMTAQQLTTLLTAMADGQTIVVSGGKLVVDPTSAPKAKLQAITTALRKSGGGLSVDSSTGKLIVDFSSMDPDIMRNIVIGMVQEGGGIAVDSNNQIFVDFASMPTDKFDALLKELRLPKWLEGAKSFYVDIATGKDPTSQEWKAKDASGNFVEAGRGESTGKPFKTIGYAVQYVAENYNMGIYRATIFVNKGDYGTGRISLPSYSATTGVIRIMGTGTDWNAADYDPENVKCGYFILRDAVEYEVYNLTARVDAASVGSNAAFIATAGTINVRNVIADVSGTNFTGGVLYACYATSYGNVRIWAAQPTGSVAAMPTGMTYKYGNREWNGGVPSGVGAQPSGLFFATESGSINFAADITLIGSTTWHTACAHAQRLSQVIAGHSSYSNPGRPPVINVEAGYAIAGVRYKSDVLSIVSGRTVPPDDLAGATYFPGTVSGTTSYDGQYTAGAGYDPEE